MLKAAMMHCLDLFLKAKSGQNAINNKPPYGKCKTEFFIGPQSVQIHEFLHSQTYLVNKIVMDHHLIYSILFESIYEIYILHESTYKNT